MKILICNAGSTSLKFKLFEMSDEHVIAVGGIERVGDPSGGAFKYKGKKEIKDTLVISNYEMGIRCFLEKLTSPEYGVISSCEEIDAVGFKTVLSKGYYGTHRIDEKVIQGMRDYMTVAPVHNSCYLEAIETFQKVLPNTVMIGAFETEFHQTIPKEAYLYSVPYEWYEKYGIRRYGYHGASHSWVATCLNERMGSHYKAVSCHLGGSSSLCAIVDGKSVDTSFGMSLQTGLLQSSRSGDIDPYLIHYMIEEVKMPSKEIFETLRTQAGVKGISGISGDMRDIEAVSKENERAALAQEMYCRELTRYIGGYAALMGGLDAIVFTGGIGENRDTVRRYVMEKLAFLGVIPKEEYEISGITEITEKESKLRVFVIPADEETVVARRAAKLLENI